VYTFLGCVGWLLAVIRKNAEKIDRKPHSTNKKLITRWEYPNVTWCIWSYMFTYLCLYTNSYWTGTSPTTHPIDHIQVNSTVDIWICTWTWLRRIYYYYYYLFIYLFIYLIRRSSSELSWNNKTYNTMLNTATWSYLYTVHWSADCGSLLGPLYTIYRVTSSAIVGLVYTNLQSEYELSSSTRFGQFEKFEII